MAKTLVSRLRKQVDILCLVDNSPYPSDIFSNEKMVKYFHYPENLGVAGAQNIGLEFLLSEKCDFGILFDQDSHPSESMVEDLVKTFLKAQNSYLNNLIAIGPTIRCEFSDRIVESTFQKPSRCVDNVQVVRQIIASGMLIDLKNLKNVGFKETELFIDAVDHEWCWRAQKCGYVVGMASNSVMTHRLGDGRKIIFGISIKIGSPIRLYYQFRNILILLRRGYVPKYWKIRNSLMLPLRFIVNSVLLSDRAKRVRFMIKGVIDGILNRTGVFKR